jgi:hypothetical protein
MGGETGSRLGGRGVGQRPGLIGIQPGALFGCHVRLNALNPTLVFGENSHLTCNCTLTAFGPGANSLLL